MITGVIDLGTNTFNLLLQDDSGKVIYNDKIPVKLGKGGINEGLIAPDAFARGIDALKRYAAVCKQKNVAQVFAFATSAVRSASNAAAFVAAARDECSIQINVISGDREAELIYEGVRQAMPIPAQGALIVDIGGGSTECIVANNNEVLWEISLPLGVSRLAEKFKPSDPLQSIDIERLNNYFAETFEPVLTSVATHKPAIMIGSSGSFETLHSMCAASFGLPELQPTQTQSEVSLYHLEKISKKLIHSTLTERLTMPGMLEMRADTLHISALQIAYLLSQTKIKTLKLSLFALKEGVMATLNKKHELWQVSSL